MRSRSIAASWRGAPRSPSASAKRRGRSSPAAPPPTSAPAESRASRWVAAGDANGFLGLALDNVTNLVFLPSLQLLRDPLVGLVALGVLLLALVGGVRMPLGLPGAFAAVLAGTVVHWGGVWLTGRVDHAFTVGTPVMALPWPTLAWLDALDAALPYLSVALPFALVTIIGGIDNTESAAAVLIQLGGVLAALGKSPADLRGDAALTYRTLLVLGNGFILTAVLWGWAVVTMIDRRFLVTAAVLAVASLATLVGLVHSPLPGGALFWPWAEGAPRAQALPLAGAYGVLAALCAAASLRRL